MENPGTVFTQISDFLDYLGSDFSGTISKLSKDGLDLSPKFPFLCSRHFADLIKKSSHPEALLREVLPLTVEREKVPGFVDDPVGDLPAGKSDCVIQKYDRRALIVSTATCGVRCRFCFRKNYPFQNGPDVAREVSNWLDTHSDVWEVILSGGDPHDFARSVSRPGRIHRSPPLGYNASHPHKTPCNASGPGNAAF